MVFLHRILEGLETRSSVGHEYDGFAIENDLTDRQLARGQRDARKAGRPIMALPGIERCFAAGDVARDAVSIQLDFAQPVIVRWRLGHHGCQLQFDTLGHAGPFHAGNRL